MKHKVLELCRTYIGTNPHRCNDILVSQEGHTTNQIHLAAIIMIKQQERVHSLTWKVGMGKAGNTSKCKKNVAEQQCMTSFQKLSSL